MQPPAPETGKIAYLDGLRGFAALVVVFTHFARAFYPAMFELDSTQPVHHPYIWAAFTRTPLMVFFSGGFAVCSFFCLSGYVLSNRYFRKRDRLIAVEGALHRYFRLTIPILCASILSYLLLSFGLMRNVQAAMHTGSVWLYKYMHVDPVFFNMFREAVFDVYFHGSRMYNPVLWTMETEFLGSYIVYSTLLLFGRHKARYFVYATLLVYFSTSYYAGFIIGMLLSDLSVSGVLARLTDKNRILLPLAAAGVVLASASPYIYRFLGVTSENSVMHVVYPMVGASFLFVALLGSGYMKRFFSTRPMIFLGKVSFSLYLIHFLLIYSFSCMTFNQLVTRMPYNAAAFLTIGLSLPVMFGLSYIMYLYVDLTSLKFSRAFSRKVLEAGMPVVRRVWPGKGV